MEDVSNKKIKHLSEMFTPFFTANIQRIITPNWEQSNGQRRRVDDYIYIYKGSKKRINKTYPAIDSQESLKGISVPGTLWGRIKKLMCVSVDQRGALDQKEGEKEGLHCYTLNPFFLSLSFESFPKIMLFFKKQILK